MPAAPLSPPADRVAEVQGLFGPVSLSERTFQKLWRGGNFRAENLRTLSGKPLEIVSRGKWNRLDGPDFLGAEFRIGGERVVGDVEFHFYAEDWDAHGHGANPAFGNVALHVLLFPPKKDFPRRNAAGNAMETFLLLPHLNVDVEEYASAEALAAIEGRAEGDATLEFLLRKNLREREELLVAAARERWTQKTAFMRRRLEKTPPDALPHELVLETLGLRRKIEDVVRILKKSHPDLLEVVRAARSLAALAGLIQRRKQHRGKNRNDCNDY